MADDDGKFEIDLNPAQKNGEKVDVTAKADSKNESTPVEMTAPDITKPDTPTEVIVSEDGSTVTGKGEPGADVILKDKDNNVIGTGKVQEDGSFEVELETPLTNGEDIKVSQKDPAGNESGEVTVTAPDTTAPEITDVQIDADNIMLTVETEPHALVKLYDSEGNPLLDSNGNPIEFKADGNGHAEYAFDPAIERGKIIEITATDEAGNESAKTQLIAGVAETIAATDNYVDVVLDAQPKEIVNSKPSDLNKDGFTVVNVGLGPVLGLDILADVVKNSVQLEVAKDTVREITVSGAAGGVQVLATMDLYLYKFNETTQEWEQHDYKENWVVSYLLGGKSKDTDFSLTEGKWMFVMASGEGIQALTGYGLNFSKDVVLDYSQAESITGSAEGNMLTDVDAKYGQDELPEGSKLTAINGIDISPNAPTLIHGKYGTLTVNADGSYSYTVNPDFRGYGEKDVFTYTVTSPTGKTSEAELTFELNLTPKEERLEVDNIVLLDTEPKMILDTDKSEIENALGFKVLQVGLLGPVLGADILGGSGAMSFDVGENQIRELTFHGSAGGVTLGSTYDMYIYKLDPATGNYIQVHHEADWFLAVLGGKSKPLTLEFGEGSYKAILQSKGGLSLLTGAGLYVDHDTIYDYNQPTKYTGQVSGDATADADTVLLKVKAEGKVDQVVEPGKPAVINGKYGTLIINADGSYTYTVSKPANAPADWKPPYGQVDQFQLVTQDKNGKSIVETLNIKIGIHTASNDFDNVQVTETNVETKIEFIEVDKPLHNYGKSYNKEFDVAAHVKPAVTTLSVTTSTDVFKSNVVLTYTLTNTTTGDVFTHTVTADKAKLDITLPDLPKGHYQLSINSEDGKIESIDFKTTVLHSKDYKVIDTPEINGKLFENDTGIKNIASIKVGNKELYSDPNKGAKEFSIEGNYGTLTVYKDGSYKYHPKGEAYGVDKFIYQTISKVGTVETATLEINVGKNVTGSDYSEQVTSSKADDIFTMGEASDTLIFNLLEDADATGGNGHDTWTDFEIGLDGDQIDISKLLEDSGATKETLSDFLKVNKVGDDTVLSIDRDGQGDKFAQTDFLTLKNVDTTLEDLLHNQQIHF
ncbi:hypothetical protein KPC_3361 [Acinetobacter stercoris]|uniref:Bacterial Ig domain-containing protein n=1 Tax=Acinetobacter stercoris TaxID=2126983 RepID=A0A2U3N3H0_9GAMM|nr:hypothetical protein KPC_3361 [Acinetobacter stercoris]